MRALGDYTLLEVLGSTELGTVHLAIVGDLEESCLVEIVDDEIAADAERAAATLLEVASARRFAHPQVDTLEGAGRAPGEAGRARLWIARPYREGWSLSALLDYADRVSELLLVQVSVWLTARLAETIEAAHRHGLLHGALAPASVRLDAEARVFLRDLGLGGLLGGSERRLAFRAPELLLSEVLTPRADVYGLGMILLTCLVGHNPFARPDPLSTRRAVLEHRIPRVRALRPALSPRVDDLLHRLCAPDPESRPSTAGEVARLLDELLGPSAHLVPSVFARQLARVPPERSLDPEAVRRARARWAAETRSETRAETPAPVPAPARRPRAQSGLAVLPGPPDGGRVGRFDLRERVCAEGPTSTHRAVDTDSGEATWLRVLDPRAGGSPSLPLDTWRALFEQEAALASTLAHPCVLRFRDAGDAEGRPWIAFTPPPRETLAERLRRAPPAEPRAVLLDLARALAHLHARGVVAAGLGPHGIRVSSRGLTVLADLSRLSPIGGALHPRLPEDPLALTPEYAAARRHDPASDLFLLGVIGYTLLTGTRPFRGLDSWTVMASLRAHTPRPPEALEPTVSAALSELTMRLLSRDPGARPASAQDVANVLEGLGPA
jgi:serine/threonine protein kinase